MHYQPKYNPQNNEVVGAEALIRWQKPDGSMVAPGIFISLAEKNGFISRLDRFIFHEVCISQKEWMDIGLRVVPVSVNLSRCLLYNDNLADEYAGIVRDVGIPFENIQIEITETQDFENIDAFSKAIIKLHDYGFRILMDDFGVGYSSIKVLKALPVDVVKLDKSFVEDYMDDRGRKVLLNMIDLANSLNMEITAEGVETKEQSEFMEQAGCHSIQGYYYSKPVPGDVFKLLLKN